MVSWEELTEGKTYLDFQLIEVKADKLDKICLTNYFQSFLTSIFTSFPNFPASKTIFNPLVLLVQAAGVSQINLLKL